MRPQLPSSGPDRLHCEVTGNDAGPTVALVHGVMSSNRQWVLNTGALGQHFRLVLVELWGHGGSPTPTDADAFGADAVVEALDEVRRRAGTSSWSIIGHSYGGAIALQYALRRPAHTTAVVFTNSRAAMSTATREDTERYATAALAVPSLRDLPQHPVHARRLPASVHADMIADADRTSPAALGAMFRTMWQFSARARLRELAVPVTLINGRYERNFQADVHTIRAMAPHIDVVDVDAGHAVNLEAVEAFDAAALAALGVPSSPPS